MMIEIRLNLNPPSWTPIADRRRHGMQFVFILLSDGHLVKTRRQVDLREVPLNCENRKHILHTPRPSLSTTSRKLSRRQLRHNLMVPSFSLTQRSCAANGDFGAADDTSFNLWISSLLIKTSCGEKRCYLSIAGSHDSSIRWR